MSLDLILRKIKLLQKKCALITRSELWKVIQISDGKSHKNHHSSMLLISAETCFTNKKGEKNGIGNAAAFSQ